MPTMHDRWNVPLNGKKAPKPQSSTPKGKGGKGK